MTQQEISRQGQAINAQNSHRVREKQLLVSLLIVRTLEGPLLL